VKSKIKGPWVHVVGIRLWGRMKRKRSQKEKIDKEYPE
jgi:hypothetical protein